MACANPRAPGFALLMAIPPKASPEPPLMSLLKRERKGESFLATFRDVTESHENAVRALR